MMKVLIFIAALISHLPAPAQKGFVMISDILWYYDGVGGNTKLSNVVPSAVGQTGKVLGSNGTDPIWQTLSGGGDMVGANNGSDFTNMATVRGNIGLGNVTNESKSTMFTSPAFTGTVTGVTATMVGLGNVTNESKATMFDNATFTGTFTPPNTSIDLATKMTGVLPFANGGRAGSAATSATTGTMTVNMTTAIVTITPTGACTFNASSGTVGQITTFAVTTSGTTSFTLTFGTNFRKVGTLATGTTSARFFSVTFVCINGTIWQEIGRTAAQT